MAQLMNRLSLNSEGAFRTTIHNRTPHKRNSNSAVKKKINDPIAFYVRDISLKGNIKYFLKRLIDVGLG